MTCASGVLDAWFNLAPVAGTAWTMGDFDAIGRLDPIVHSPARLTILAVLAVAKEAGYVKIEKAFVGRKPHTLCRLSEVGRTAFDDYRAHMAAILEQVAQAES